MRPPLLSSHVNGIRERWKGTENDVMKKKNWHTKARKSIMGGTYQLHWPIVFPAEVSTPAAQVLRRRTETEMHGHTHGLITMTHTGTTSAMNPTSCSFFATLLNGFWYHFAICQSWLPHIKLLPWIWLCFFALFRSRYSVVFGMAPGRERWPTQFWL